jgi:hypothetical protein
MPVLRTYMLCVNIMLTYVIIQYQKARKEAKCRYLTPAILATQEAEIRRITG